MRAPRDPEPLRPFELGFAGTDLRRRLVGAVLRREKTATSSLRDEYAPHSGEPLPQAGDRGALIDHSDARVGVVEVTEVTVLPLSAVDLQFAIDEGEGHTSLAEWREAHLRFWAPREVNDDTLIVCEHFRLVRIGERR